ncbi:MAG: hypothetical protein Q7R39_10720, partial [Dehalococcoidia bacterium]|nr:hypothetical protein [Dehalococcoidia bacterium]
SSGKFFSYAAAFTTRAGAPEIIPPGRERWFIAPLGIDILPCSQEVKESLQMLGVRSVGQVSEFERGALEAQFGREGALLYDICRGIDGRPLTPWRRPQTVEVAIDLDPPVEGYLRLLHACQAMLDRPLATVREQGRACRELGVRLRLTSGGTLEKSLPFKEATLSISVILNRLRVWLEAEHFPAPVLAMELSLRLTGEPGRNLALWQERRGRKELRSAARELKTRLGFQPLKKVDFIDPDDILPERRFRLIEIGE